MTGEVNLNEWERERERERDLDTICMFRMEDFFAINCNSKNSYT